MSFLKNGIDFNPEAKTYKIQYCKAGASTTAWVSAKSLIPMETDHQLDLSLH
jgi:hypothetical protein